jgi:hypothetical protein
VFPTTEACAHTYICQDSSSNHLNIIRQATERDLTVSGNAAYMRLELALARITNEKTQLEGSISSLKDKNMRLESRLETIEYDLLTFHFADLLVFSSGRSIRD